MDNKVYLKKMKDNYHENDNNDGYGSWNSYINRVASEDSEEPENYPEDLIVVDFVDWLQSDGLGLYIEKKAREQYDWTNKANNYIDLTRSDFSEKKQKIKKIKKKRED